MPPPKEAENAPSPYGPIAMIAFVLLAAVFVYSFVSVAKEGETRRRCGPTCLLHPNYAGYDRKVPSFSLKDTRLMGFNVSIDRDEDPCEVYLSDYRAVGGKMLPHKMEVRHGNEGYAEFANLKYELKADK